MHGVGGEVGFGRLSRDARTGQSLDELEEDVSDDELEELPEDEPPSDDPDALVESVVFDDSEGLEPEP